MEELKTPKSPFEINWPLWFCLNSSFFPPCLCHFVVSYIIFIKNYLCIYFSSCIHIYVFTTLMYCHEINLEFWSTYVCTYYLENLLLLWESFMEAEGKNFFLHLCCRGNWNFNWYLFQTYNLNHSNSSRILDFF